MDTTRKDELVKKYMSDAPRDAIEFAEACQDINDMLDSIPADGKRLDLAQLRAKYIDTKATHAMAFWIARQDAIALLGQVVIGVSSSSSSSSAETVNTANPSESSSSSSSAEMPIESSSSSSSSSAEPV